MTNGGWIPAWRKLFDPDHPLAPDKRSPASKIHAWLDLCQMAQHEDYDHSGERLRRGEVLVAVRFLADRWGWSKSRVDRFMSELEARTQIGTVRGTPRGTVYRIVNYTTYATPGAGERDSERDEERDTSGTRAGQEQPLTINKEQMGGASAPAPKPEKKRKPRKRKTRIPEDWEPHENHRAKARAMHVDVGREASKFRMHHGAKGTTMLDWDKAFYTWLMKAEEFGASVQPRQGTEAAKVRARGEPSTSAQALRPVIHHRPRMDGPKPAQGEFGAIVDGLAPEGDDDLDDGVDSGEGTTDKEAA